MNYKRPKKNFSKRNQRRGKAASGPTSNDLITIHGKVWLRPATIVTANPQTMIALEPGSGGIGDARTQVMANLFRFYHFNSVKVTFSRTTTTDHAHIAFAVGGIMTPPTVLAEIVAFQNHHVQMNTEINPRTFVLRANQLRSQVHWYTTELAGVPDLELQGYFVVHQPHLQLRL